MYVDIFELTDHRPLVLDPSVLVMVGCPCESTGHFTSFGSSIEQLNVQCFSLSWISFVVSLTNVLLVRLG